MPVSRHRERERERERERDMGDGEGCTYERVTFTNCGHLPAPQINCRLRQNVPLRQNMLGGQFQVLCVCINQTSACPADFDPYELHGPM